MFPNRESAPLSPDGPDRSGDEIPCSDLHFHDLEGEADPGGGWDDPVIREWLAELSEREHAQQLAEEDAELQLHYRQRPDRQHQPCA